MVVAKRKVAVNDHRSSPSSLAIPSTTAATAMRITRLRSWGLIEALAW